MSDPAFLALHVGHDEWTIASFVIVLALIVLATVVAVVLDGRAGQPEQLAPTKVKENRS